MATAKSTTPVIAKAVVALNPGNIAAGGTEDLVAAVKGLRPGFKVDVWCEDASLEDGIAVVHAFASDKDELTVRFANYSTGAVNGAELDWNVVQR